MNTPNTQTGRVVNVENDGEDAKVAETGHNAAARPDWMEHDDTQSLERYAQKTGNTMTKTGHVIEGLFSSMVQIVGNRLAIGDIKTGLPFNPKEYGEWNYKQSKLHPPAGQVPLTDEYFGKKLSTLVNDTKGLFVVLQSDGTKVSTVDWDHNTFKAYLTPAVKAGIMLADGYLGLTIAFCDASKAIFPRKPGESFMEYSLRNIGAGKYRCLAMPSNKYMPRIKVNAHTAQLQGLPKDAKSVVNGHDGLVAIPSDFIRTVMIGMYFDGKERDEETNKLKREANPEGNNTISVNPGIEYAKSIRVAMETEVDGAPALSTNELEPLVDCLVQLLKTDVFRQRASKSSTMTESLVDLRLLLDDVVNEDGEVITGTLPERKTA